TSMAPKDEAELRQMMWTAYRHAAAGRGPIGVRFPRGAGGGARLDAPLTELTIGVSETLREGDGVAILAYGHPAGAALEAAEILAKDGLHATRARRWPAGGGDPGGWVGGWRRTKIRGQRCERSGFPRPSSRRWPSRCRRSCSLRRPSPPIRCRTSS